jgi:hypothetical protein
MIMAGISACKANFSYLNTSILGAFATWNASDLMAIVPMGAGVASFSTTSNTASDDDLCRIYHLTVATQDPNTHCPHGGILSAPCGSAAAVACRFIQTACGTSVFADQAGCLAVVGPFMANISNIGAPTVTATTNNDLSCRLYQAGMALISKNMGQPVTTACKAIPLTGNTICTGMPAMAPTSSASTVAVSAGLLALALAL